MAVGYPENIELVYMYILTFKRSSSKHFQKALNHVTYMGGSWDGETAKLIIPEKDLLTAYEDIHFLFGYNQNWESTKATFRNKPVPRYWFIFLVWNTVHQCRNARFNTADPRHCWSSVDAKGWGCKHLCRILRYSKGTPRYKTSNRYWYNFGEFIGHDTWRINKPLILERLKKEIDEKVLHLCPLFDMKTIKDAVQSLPDFIKVDKIHYTHYHTAEYIDGVKKIVPVNIRHVAPPKEIASLQDILNNDPNEYQWN